MKNVFNGQNNGGIGIDLNGTNTEANIHNNTIHWFRKDIHGNSSYSIDRNQNIWQRQSGYSQQLHWARIMIITSMEVLKIFVE